MPPRCKHCIPRNEFDQLDFLSFIGPILVFLGGIVVALATGPVGILVATIGAWWALQKACAFLRGGKLVCIQRFHCVIGRVVELEPVGHHKSGFENIDDDYAANLLIAPHRPTADPAAMMADTLQGGLLVQQHPQTTGLKFKGYTTHKSHLTPPRTGGHDIPIIHCEFEGQRVCDFCDAAAAAIAVLGLAAAFCAIPIIGWIGCLIALAVGAAIAGAILLDAWFGAHHGDPKDAAVNPGDGDLHAMDDAGNGGDYVIIRGDWDYDAGHEGWNEIHPVTSVQKIHGAPYWPEGSTDAEIARFRPVFDEWCRQTSQPEQPDVQEEQKEPRHRWHYHPVIDGCRDGDNEERIPR
jgi:hypothetical protein